MHQPFNVAVVAEPPGIQELPEQTMTGKSVGKLYTEVVALWDKIQYATPEGKRLAYKATLDTELGPIDIELRPDLAPNHVRSFIALAKVGYFDGLVFERTVSEKSDTGKGESLEFIEGGCPRGTGELNLGSIGYWLKPELVPTAKHEEGTVGCWHGEERDTAACKFYITLTRAPAMDGIFTVFGKVTRGLEVARAIRARPVHPDDVTGERPLNPVVIRSVTIHGSVLDNPGAGAPSK